MPDLKAWARPLTAALVCLGLYACATPRYAPEQPERPPPSHHHYTPPSTYERPAPPQAAAAPEYRRLADLPGWDGDDHAAAYRAFIDGCRVTKDDVLYALCRRARETGPLSEAAARAFFQDNFRLRQVEGDGLLTGYFVPEYEARDTLTPPFTAAVRPKPADLPAKGGTYADRATIEATPPDVALAWMRPEDLFFMQIQGSGVMDFPDGHRMKATFAASNGQPFVAIAAPLRQRGEIPAAGSSGNAVRAWLADHRGPDADAVMQLDPRYVFFQVAPDDGRDPAGTAGHPADARPGDRGRPECARAWRPLLDRRRRPDADRGRAGLSSAGHGAGYRRGDQGRGARLTSILACGDAAGVEAGHIRHTLRLYELIPITAPYP